ncbi:MAG: DUF1722 domain-containing protein [Deferribacteres bacterium]|nr:DUF1722 domain-containing protein [Deferribacteres bacterium]
MDQPLKPRIVISTCIEHEACRFNGQIIADEFIRNLRDLVEFIPVCPEVELGLGTPREPIRIVSKAGDFRLIQPATNSDLTKPMHEFSQKFLTTLTQIDGFILKSRSPSCGPKDVRVYSEKGQPMANSIGFFAKAVLDKFPHLAVEEEGRLRNFRIREHFLTRIFAVARFRQVKNSGSMKELVSFQAKNKFIFMAYNQKAMRRLGQIAANSEKKTFSTVTEEYEVELARVFSRIPHVGSHINVLLHGFGYFSKNLNAEEKAWFLDALEKYRQKKLPLSALLSVLRAWIARFNEHYLAQQAYFEPYPESLREIRDSGKGRDL